MKIEAQENLARASLGAQPFSPTWDEAYLYSWVHDIGFPECASMLEQESLETEDVELMEEADLALYSENMDEMRCARFVFRLSARNVPPPFSVRMDTDTLSAWLSGFGFPEVAEATRANGYTGADLEAQGFDDFSRVLGVSPTDPEGAMHLWKLIHGTGEMGGLDHDASQDAVLEWLESNGFGAAMEGVIENDLTGEDMLTLAREELEEILGIEDPDVAWRLMHRPTHNVQSTQHRRFTMVDQNEVALWSCDDVCEWMASQGFGDYTAGIVDGQLDGPTMLQLSPRELHEVLDLPEFELAGGLQVEDNFDALTTSVQLAPFSVEWSTDGVVQWMVEHGFDEAAEVVAEQQLEGIDILELTAEEAVEIFGIADELLLKSFLESVHSI